VAASLIQLVNANHQSIDQELVRVTVPKRGNDMSTATSTSTTITARTQFLHAKNETYAYRRFGHGAGFPSYAFSDLKNITQPTLVVNGVHDEMIPVSNSYSLGGQLPNAVLLTYPDSGNGSLFQFHESFTRQASAFLASDSLSAPF